MPRWFSGGVSRCGSPRRPWLHGMRRQRERGGSGAKLSTLPYSAIPMRLKAVQWPEVSLGLDELFEGRHFDREVIVLCVRWYLRFKLSYRDLVEMMAERGLPLAHTTIMRWVHHYAPEFERRWNRFARTSWVKSCQRVDETYVKIRGKSGCTLYPGGGWRRSDRGFPLERESATSARPRRVFPRGHQQTGIDPTNHHIGRIRGVASQPCVR